MPVPAVVLQYICEAHIKYWEVSLLLEEDFFKFLSLISAFKDVVIGEESILVESELNIVEDKPEKIQEYSQIEDDLYQINSKPSEESMENNDTEELNPEEWDPW